MWKCECGEQIEDQFDACWKCAGRNPAEPGTEAPRVEEPIFARCPHCKIDLEYLGKKRFHEGGHLTPILAGDLFVNRENFDLYVCTRCGRAEFFLEGVGEEFRPKKFSEDKIGEEQNSVSE